MKKEVDHQYLFSCQVTKTTFYFYKTTIYNTLNPCTNPPFCSMNDTLTRNLNVKACVNAVPTATKCSSLYLGQCLRSIVFLQKIAPSFRTHPYFTGVELRCLNLNLHG